MKGFLKLLVLLAVIGGGTYAGWYYLVRDKEDLTPAQRACREERGMVKLAIDKATADVQRGDAADLGIINPDTYIHVDTAPQYYTWTTAPLGWSLQPVGTPPC